MTEPSAKLSARQLLEQTSGRVTKPRLEVLETLCNTKRAVSHADLQRLLPKHDRVSLYRILDWLSEHHLIESLAGDDGVRRFIAHAPNEEAHPHFHCRSCGVATCFHGISITQTEQNSDHDIERISVVVTGICPECKARVSLTFALIFCD